MSGILDLLTSQVGQAGLSAITKQLGSDSRQTQAAISTALPLLMGALNRNAQQKGGAEALAGALDKKHDGSILDNLSGFIGGGNFSDGDGILKHVLGGRRSNIEQGVSKASGLDASKVSGLLSMLAPIVMGAIGKQKRSSGLDVGGLMGLLTGEQERAQKAAPNEMGLIGKLLDQDGDGSMVDDVASMGMNLLGKFLKGK